MLKHLLLISIIATRIASTNAQIALLPNESIPFKVIGKSGQIMDVIDMINEPFKKAYHISTLNQTSNDAFILRYNIDYSVRKDDILLRSFYTRNLQSKKETGEAFMEIALDRFIDGKYNWPPVFERGMSFGAKWVLTQIPFKAARNVAKGEMILIIKCSNFPQVFEIADITLVNYQQSVKLNDLPHSKVHYGGDAPMLHGVRQQQNALKIQKRQFDNKSA